MNAPHEKPVDILLIKNGEESPAEARALADLMKDLPILCTAAASLRAGMEALYKKPYDLILLDTVLPDSSGLNAVAQICGAAPFLPVIALIKPESEDLGEDAIMAGAQDYLMHGSIAPDVFARSIRYSRERHQLKEALKSMSLIDPLTGLYTQSGFLAAATPQIKMAARNNRASLVFHVTMLGHDKILDTLGAHERDTAIFCLARILHKVFRASDIIGRYEFDEFAVFASDASAENGDPISRRLDRKIEEARVKEGWPFHFGVRTGYLMPVASGEFTLDELVGKARLLAK
jgi:two-component system cell cycle response regulator